jgi:hypothetical protein
MMLQIYQFISLSHTLLLSSVLCDIKNMEQIEWTENDCVPCGYLLQLLVSILVYSTDCKICLFSLVTSQFC